MSKELWVDCYDRLLERFADDNPDATDAEAHAYAEAHIGQEYADYIGGMIDAARDRAKYGDAR